MSFWPIRKRNFQIWNALREIIQDDLPTPSESGLRDINKI